MSFQLFVPLPLLTRFRAKEPRFFSELLQDVWAPRSLALSVTTENSYQAWEREFICEIQNAVQWMKSSCWCDTFTVHVITIWASVFQLSITLADFSLLFPRCRVVGRDLGIWFRLASMNVILLNKAFKALEMEISDSITMKWKNGDNGNLRVSCTHTQTFHVIQFIGLQTLISSYKLWKLLCKPAQNLNNPNLSL